MGIVLDPPCPAPDIRAMLAAFSLVLAIATLRLPCSSRRRRALGGVALATGLFLAGGIAAAHQAARAAAARLALPPALDFGAGGGRTVRLTGRFETDAEESGGRGRAIVRTERIEDGALSAPFPARILLSWPVLEHAGLPSRLAGRAVSGTVRLFTPSSYGNPGAYDAAAGAARKGLAGFAMAKSPRLLAIEVGETGASLPTRALRRYQAIFDRLYTTPRQAGASLSPEGAVLRASVLGGRLALPPETERALVASGTYHIIAVSGLQVAVVGGVFLALLLRAPVSARVATVCAAGSILFYAQIVAPSASVQRATCMAMVACAGRVLARRPLAATTLAHTAIGLLAVFPSDLFDPGFQLSFAATAGILLFAESLISVLRARWGLSALLAASLAAQAAAAPATAYWFQRMVPFGLVSNLLAVPLGSLAVVLGVCLLPAEFLGEPVLRIVGGAAGLACRALLAIASIPVEGSFLSFRVALPRPGLVAAAAGGLALLAIPREVPRRAGFALTAVVLLVMALDGRVSPFTSRAAHESGAEGRLVMDLVDVGQGDAILVIFPDGETMLVDGGGRAGSDFDVGARALVPELLRLGILRLGRVVLTHGHEDHGGGLREVLRSIRVDEFISPDAPEEQLRDDLETLGRAQGARVLRVRRGYRIHEAGTEVLCLSPFSETLDDPNGDSIVLRFETAARSILLAGDIGTDVERHLLKDGLAPADVLKVAHHGSATATSEGLLEALHPRIAVISVGASNPFGHPSSKVLDRLAKRHIAVLRTDRDGAVRVATDGRELLAGSLRPEHPLGYPGPSLRPALPAARGNLDREGDERQDEDGERGQREHDAEGPEPALVPADRRVRASSHEDENPGPEEPGGEDSGGRAVRDARRRSEYDQPRDGARKLAPVDPERHREQHAGGPEVRDGGQKARAHETDHPGNGEPRQQPVQPRRNRERHVTAVELPDGKQIHRRHEETKPSGHQPAVHDDVCAVRYGAVRAPGKEL